ncbi:MAG: DNA-directed polymerase [Frankiales bacterium]|nr:DNA-directed polymerase [Frankiales bacterium]
MGRSADLPRSSGEVDGDDSGCHILHVDMDAFFASVEIRARPELRGLPVLVGGTQGRGVVAAASYAARAFGVRSAMSMGLALRLCPQAVVISPRHGAYGEVSAAVMKIFSEVTPHVEPLSLDEAFLDVSGSIGLFGRPADIARHIRRRVFAEQQLTCSVGIAPTKSVAKLASGSCKPDGLRVVSQAGLLDFLHPLPVTALWGVGARTAEPLRRLGIRTVGELALTPIDQLRRAVGVATAEHLHALANARDDRTVTPRAAEKSISTDRTLSRDLLTEDEIARELLRGANEVGERLRQAKRRARTVGIKIRFADFNTLTRVRTLAEATDSGAQIYAEALALYRSLKLDQPRVRLVGVKAENLRPAGEATQLALDLTGAPVPGAVNPGAVDMPHRPSAPRPVNTATVENASTPANASTPEDALTSEDAPTPENVSAPTNQPTPANGADPVSAARSVNVPRPVNAARRAHPPGRSVAARLAANSAAAERAIDAVTIRFGSQSVQPATLLPRSVDSHTDAVATNAGTSRALPSVAVTAASAIPGQSDSATEDSDISPPTGNKSIRGTSNRRP